MDVMQLQIPPKMRFKLQSAGYRTLDWSVSPIQLARDLQITPKQAVDILKLIPRTGFFGMTRAGHPPLKTAWELLQNEMARKRIVTSCKELDDILGGGIASHEVTEISGAPGVGKTQLSMQLAINVQIPPEFDGIGGHVVYIDTEGSFMYERAMQMAQTCTMDIKRRTSANPRVDLEQIEAKLHPKTFLSHIYYFRVFSATEVIAVVQRMEKFLVDYSQVRLIVIDSIAFPFRQGFDDMAARTRLLSSLSQKLYGLAEKHKLAVVIVNQMTLKMTGEGKKLVPALGESWAHATTNRLTLLWKDGQRYAHLNKCPYLPRRGTPFAVTRQGIQSAPKGSNQLSRFD